MEIDLFHQKIVRIIESECSNTSSSKLILVFATFLKCLTNIFSNQHVDHVTKITRLTILFEGFFQFITSIRSKLVNDLASLRLERWCNHYGVPTITFLLTYTNQIQQIISLFSSASTLTSFQMPWEISHKENFIIDDVNHVLIDKQSPNSIKLPVEEKIGQLIKTYNPSGGFTTTPCDPVSQRFIEYASTHTTVLEVGAAFGAASLQAVKKGAVVFCNDISPSNLAVVSNRYSKSMNQPYSVTGDDNSLVLLPGAFPDQLTQLPRNFFDAILICRVLHFFSGEKIEQSLQQLRSHLKLGGKLFIVCETPYLKNWQRFIPVYETKVKYGVKWPGEITNPTEFETSGRSASLPNSVHWITKDILERSLVQSQFNIEHLSYIDRSGQFPQDLLLDGKESIGAIAIKASY